MKYGIVVIAASAGGVVAVRDLLSGLPATFQVPILIAQHRHTTPTILEGILRRCTPLSVVDAMDGNALRAGTVVVAPADRHLLLDMTGVLRLSGAAKVNYVRPAADPLFASVADFYRERTIGVVLTGNGIDGSHGVESIGRMGGYVIAQEPRTAEAPEMPSAAIQTGCVNAILPLNEIGPALLDLMSV
jgi:two-component system chemotaxis response regulator CheB